MDGLPGKKIEFRREKGFLACTFPVDLVNLLTALQPGVPAAFSESTRSNLQEKAALGSRFDGHPRQADPRCPKSAESGGLSPEMPEQGRGKAQKKERNNAGLELPYRRREDEQSSEEEQKRHRQGPPRAAISLLLQRNSLKAYPVRAGYPWRLGWSIRIQEKFGTERSSQTPREGAVAECSDQKPHPHQRQEKEGPGELPEYQGLPGILRINQNIHGSSTLPVPGQTGQTLAEMRRSKGREIIIEENPLANVHMLIEGVGIRGCQHEQRWPLGGPP